MRKAVSNTRDPAFWARFEPHRYAIRPAECDMGGDGHTCWVRQPYEAISPNQLKPRCTGCGGLIAPVKHGQHLTGFWPEAQRAILERLERGER